MNKLLIIPLFVMVILAIFGLNMSLTDNPESITEITSDTGIVILENGEYGFIYDGEEYGIFVDGDRNHPYDPRETPGEPLGLYLRHERKVIAYDDLQDFTDTWKLDYLAVTEGERGIYNIMDSGVLWGVIIAILAASTAFGVKVFGSGLSEFSQRTLYLSLAWGTLWAFLSITSYDLLTADSLGVFGGILYFALTFIFIIGIMQEVTSSD